MLALAFSFSFVSYILFIYIGALRKGGTPQRARLASVVCLFVSGSNDNAGVASATSASKRRAGPGWSHLTQRMKASVSHRVCRAQCQPTGARRRSALKSRLRPSRPRPRLEPDETITNGVRYTSTSGRGW